MWYKTSTLNNRQTDPIVDSVIKKYHERSQAGVKKYGTMLTRDDLSTLDWLKHLQEELQDATLYIERLMIVRNESDIDQYYRKAAEIVGKDIDRLEPVYNFMKALNITMESVFEITDNDGNPKTVKVSDVFFNL
jgi:hypothetical protein